MSVMASFPWYVPFTAAHADGQGRLELVRADGFQSFAPPAWPARAHPDPLNRAHTRSRGALKRWLPSRVMSQPATRQTLTVPPPQRDCQRRSPSPPRRPSRSGPGSGPRSPSPEEPPRHRAERTPPADVWRGISMPSALDGPPERDQRQEPSPRNVIASPAFTIVKTGTAMPRNSGVIRLFPSPFAPTRADQSSPSLWVLRGGLDRPEPLQAHRLEHLADREPRSRSAIRRTSSNSGVTVHRTTAERRDLEGHRPERCRQAYQLPGQAAAAPSPTAPRWSSSRGTATLREPVGELRRGASAVSTVPGRRPLHDDGVRYTSSAPAARRRSTSARRAGATCRRWSSPR